MNFREFKKKYQVKKVQEFSNSVSSHPCLSICVQTYEHVSFIKKCLEGLLLQKTTFPFEILLGDDGSTDGTREICIEYAEKFPNKIRLFLHHRENNIKINGSPTGRFNFLYNLYNARGKYIAFCEGDDYWTDPLKLQKQVDFLETNEGYSLCFTRFKVKNENEDVLSDDKNGHYFKENDEHIEFDFQKFVQGWYGGMPTLVFRASSFNIMDVSNYKNFRDVHLITELLINGRGVCINLFTALYRIHDGGIHSSATILQSARIGSQCYQEIYYRHKEVELLKVKYRNFHDNYVSELINQRKYLNAVTQIIVYGLSMKDYTYVKLNCRKIVNKIMFYKGFKSVFRRKLKTKKFQGSKNYWEARYKGNDNSGAGSYGRLAEFKAEVLNNFVKSNNIQNIIEYGCGDGNQLSLSNYPNYIGLDVSITAKETCQKKFKNDDSKFFYLANEFINENIKAELVLSLDVIYHLIEDYIFENYMSDIFNHSTKYVIIYSSNYNDHFEPHVKCRKFTDWIEKNVSATWKLKEIINNKYPFNKMRPDTTSMSDFYIYEKL